VEFYLQLNTVWVTSSYLLRVICDWFSSAYLPRILFVPVFFILFDLTTSVCPEIETSSFDWAHQTRYPPLLPDEGDRFQSPKRRVFLIIIRRWIMSIKFVTYAIIYLRIRNCICLNDNTKLLKYLYLNSGDTLITISAAMFIFPFHLHFTHFYTVTSEVCGIWFPSSSITSSEKTITFYMFSGRATRLFISGAG
jgi:hypothetical protein